MNRDKRGRFAKKSGKLILILAVLVVVFYIGQLTSKEVYTSPTSQVKTVDNLAKKIEDIKNEALADLMQCESAGHSEDDGIIIFDTNNEASIGQFQFQRKTVQYYYKSIYNKDISRKEAILIALDTDKAKELAHDIIFKTDKGYTNWLNCSKKNKLPETLALLDKLEN